MSNRFLFYCAVTAVLAVTVPIYINKAFLLILLLLFCILLKKLPIKQVLILLFLFTIFCTRSYYSDRANISQLTGEESILQISFSSYPEINGDQISGLAKLNDKENIWVTYRVDHEREAIELKNTVLTGKTFRVTGKLEKPIHETVENGFDFFSYLRFHKAHWILRIDTKEEVSKKVGNLFVKLAQMREGEIKRIDQLYSETSGSFTKALIFGEQSSITEEMYNQFKKLGIIHILALSGMQVALVSAILFYIFLRIGMTRRQTYALLACILPLYAVITGWSASIVRACIMASIYMAGQFLGIRITALKTITICLLGYIFLDPYQVFQIGFQLSFMLTYGLILSINILQKSTNSPIVSLLIMTALCQLISTPIVLYHFYEISLISLISNLLYVPVFTYLLFPVTISIYLFVVFDFLIDPGLRLLDLIYYLLEKSIAFMSDLPATTLLFGKPSNLIMALIVFCFITILIEAERRSKMLLRVCMITFLVMGYQYNYQRFPESGEVTFLDVGQGDSTFISLPGRRGNYLIDTGGATFFSAEDWTLPTDQFDPGEDIILPYLKSKGIRVIDKLILTHADQDHIGGAKAIIKAIKVCEVVIPFEQRKEFRDTEVIKEAINQHIPIREVKAGMEWDAGDATFRILSPVEKTEEKNESSIVIKMRMNQLDWLLVGDLGEEGEQKLLQTETDLKADILKVGHHGSKNSSTEEFINAVNPTIAVISSGRNNRFGHPHKEVIDLLNENKITIYRTDLQGSIQYKFKNKKDGTLSIQRP